MRYLAIAVLALALAGCLPETHDSAASKAEAAKAWVDEARKVIGSDTAKIVTDAIGKIPAPGAQVVPVARDKVEWGLGILSGLLGTFAAWQTKKAASERSKKRTYKSSCSKDGLDAANRAIYGSDFKAELSK